MALSSPLRRLSAACSAAFLSSLLPAAPVAAVEATPPELYGELTDEQREEADQFTLNVAIGTVFHEAGHMLVSELSLPVLGREEDAVDGLAMLLLLEADDEDLNVVVEDWANIWFLSADPDAKPEDMPSWDSHGLNEQRAYSTICWMLGKNAKRFKEFADSVEFPDYRAEECPGEYQTLAASWGTVLKPHEAGEGDQTKFTITYDETKDPKLAYFREMIRNAGLMEMVAEVFSGTYKLKDGIKLTASECGEANAYWDSEAREMTLCYEDLQNSANLDAQWYIDNPDEE